MSETPSRFKKWKSYLFFVPVVIGVFVLYLGVQKQRELRRRPQAEKTYSVRTIEVPSVDFVSHASGYGNVQPASTWEAIGEVSGKIVVVHPQLKKGAFIKKGDLLLKIDATDYELAVRQQEANIQSIKAQIPELEVQESNTRASLKIEKNALSVAEKELKRLRTLASKGASSQKAADQQKRTVLAQKQSVQSLRNSLNLFPSQREVLAAQLSVAETQLENAGINLARTAINLPFDARIAEVMVDKSQFINQGQTLLVADGLDLAEISAQFSVEKMRNLLSSVTP
ncbi:MAG: biotin/lipoyl-binding protein, partial [Proteobacteria bacterium]|nr:biotin/lipoyl-binding protein [Pseudomonadota bacterium]